MFVHWTICPTFYECHGSSQRDHLVPNTHLMRDAAAGDLPAFSFVIPIAFRAQHQPGSASRGDNWIGSVVDAIQADTTDWLSTAIFITYDDCGCFYDPVNPLQYNAEWGVRVRIRPVEARAWVERTDAEALKLLAEAEEAQKGRGYFLRRSREERIEREVERMAGAAAEDAHSALAAMAVDAVLPASPSDPDGLLNGAYLVRREDADSFRRAVEAQDRRFGRS